MDNYLNYKIRKLEFIHVYTNTGVTWIVYLHTPRVFHSLMDLSLDPDTICLLSAEKATLSTSLV